MTSAAGDVEREDERDGDERDLTLRGEPDVEGALADGGGFFARSVWDGRRRGLRAGAERGSVGGRGRVLR